MILSIISIILVIINVAITFILLLKLNSINNSKELELISNNLDGLKEKIKDINSQSLVLNKNLREELANQIVNISKLQGEQLNLFSNTQGKHFKHFSDELTRVMQRLDEQLNRLQKDNATHLEKIRETVDEKLTTTLNKRLAEQFKVISERLEQVHKGLGEMQSLATGVGDLKRILSGVKTRGVWGEVQLSQILEQFLSKEQYDENVKVKPRSQEVVEFAIKLPGKDDDNNVVYLPIDSKFPIEDYQRLLDAYDQADKTAVALAIKSLETRVKQEARRISTKYIAVPYTTDFAIMYLPTEGLYSEIIQRRGLLEELQRKYRIVVAGPSTITAFIISLQMGFKTLAIEKRSSEVWKVLGTIKTEFSKFAGLLEKTSKKLQETKNVIDQAVSKTRNIERKLNKVEGVPELPASTVEPVSEAADILNLPISDSN